MKTLICFSMAFAVLFALAASEANAQEKQWARIFPCEADGAQAVRDSAGNMSPSTGQGACTYFNWGGAGNWKRFKVRKGDPVIIMANGDS